MQIDDIEDKVVKCTSFIEEERFVSFSVFPWENPWRTPTIHGKMSTKKSHKLTNIVNGPEKTSWPFPQFTTSANKGEAWECSAYILPTSSIDKDPLFLFLNLKNSITFTKSHVLDLSVGDPLPPEVELAHCPRETLHFLKPIFVPNWDCVVRAVSVHVVAENQEAICRGEKSKQYITTLKRRQGRHLNGKVCRL